MLYRSRSRRIRRRIRSHKGGTSYRVGGVPKQGHWLQHASRRRTFLFGAGGEHKRTDSSDACQVGGCGYSSHTSERNGVEWISAAWFFRATNLNPLHRLRVSKIDLRYLSGYLRSVFLVNSSSSCCVALTLIKKIKCHVLWEILIATLEVIEGVVQLIQVPPVQRWSQSVNHSKPGTSLNGNNGGKYVKLLVLFTIISNPCTLS